MKQLSVLIVVLGMSQTAFAATPSGAVKQEFAPTTMSQQEVQLWEGATSNLGQIGVVGDWLSEGDYALGEILQLLFLMKDLVGSADRIEYLSGEDLTKFLKAQHRVRELVQLYRQELLAMMASPGVPPNRVVLDRTYFAPSSFYLFTSNDFDLLAELQGRRHLVHRLTVNGRNSVIQRGFIVAFNHRAYRQVLENITELRLNMLNMPNQPRSSEELLEFFSKNPQLLPHLRVLRLEGVPEEFSLGDFGTSALGQQLHTLTLQAGPLGYHFDRLIEEIGSRGSFKNLKSLHLLPRRINGFGARVNVTAAGLKQLRSASFELTHLTLPENPHWRQGSILASLFESSCLAGLKELTMDVTWTDPAALMRALGGLKHLEVWDISGSKVPLGFWSAVVGSQVYQRLRSLIAQSTHMDKSAAAIVGQHPSPSLLFLDVRQNAGIGKEGYAALAGAAFPHLRTLGMGHANDPDRADPDRAKSPLSLEAIRQILEGRHGLPELQTIIRQGLQLGINEFDVISHSGPPIVFSGNVTQLIELPGTARDKQGLVTIPTNCSATFSEQAG